MLSPSSLSDAARGEIEAARRMLAHCDLAGERRWLVKNLQTHFAKDLAPLKALQVDGPAAVPAPLAAAVQRLGSINELQLLLARAGHLDDDPQHEVNEFLMNTLQVKVMYWS